jgi:hypothetical protein
LCCLLCNSTYEAAQTNHILQVFHTVWSWTIA